MITLIKKNNTYEAYSDDISLGTILLRSNPYHGRNCYVDLKLNRLDDRISGELFRKLRALAHRPLQIMTESDNTELIRFLEAGGFLCSRKCYETEAGEKDFVGENSAVCLRHCRKGVPDYARCCKLLYDYYVQTHAAVNPWTADYESFAEKLPAEAVYSSRGGVIDALSFVDGNEIAYVYGTEPEGFSNFASGLIQYMLNQHDRIWFESDDCDWAAMCLRSQFQNLDETSYNTYILENNGNR